MTGFFWDNFKIQSGEGSALMQWVFVFVAVFVRLLGNENAFLKVSKIIRQLSFIFGYDYLLPRKGVLELYPY